MDGDYEAFIFTGMIFSYEYSLEKLFDGNIWFVSNYSVDLFFKSKNSINIDSVFVVNNKFNKPILFSDERNVAAFT